MSKKNSPAIIRHEEVEVFGSPILVAVDENEEKYFSVSHMCRAIGMDPASQRRKIMADENLSVSLSHMTFTGADGKNYKMSLLPIEMLSGWLFMTNPNKVKPSVKPALLKYRAEAYAILDAWFRQGARSEQDGDKMQQMLLETVQKAIAPLQVQLEAVAIENRAMKPKVDAYDNITDQGQVFLLSNVAREVGVPRSVLTMLLTEGGVVETRFYSGQNRSIPTDYAKSANLTTDYYNAQGIKQVSPYYLTAKGRSLCERLAFDWKAQQEAA